MKSGHNNKLETLIKTAHALFMRHGIRRVSVEEICAEANISKMTFYKYFKNKIELTKYLIKQVSKEQMNDYRKIMAKEIPFEAKVRHMIQLKNDQTYMISQEFFNDLCKNPIPELVELLADLRSISLKEIINDFEIARENGDIRGDIKPEFILYILKKLSEMNKDENLIKLYQNPNEVIMELTNFFFYGIINLEREKNIRI
jgi:AcrR family transcriptional regulator